MEYPEEDRAQQNDETGLGLRIALVEQIVMYMMAIRRERAAVPVDAQEEEARRIEHRE